MKLALLTLVLSLAPADDKAGTVQDIPLGPLGGEPQPGPPPAAGA